MSASFGSPNWESESKTAKCCFWRSDVSRCEQYELSLLNETMRQISRRALSGTSDSCIPLCGIGRSEEMACAKSTVSVIRWNIIPSRPFTVSLRSKQWLSSWCHGSAWFGQKKKHRFCGVFLYGCPNWLDLVTHVYRLRYWALSRGNTVGSVFTSVAFAWTLLHGSPFTVSLRSKQWLLSWCHGSAH